MQSEEQTEKRMKENEALRDVGNTIKYTNICIVGVSEGKETNTQKEIMGENFQSLMKNLIYRFKKIKKL